MEAVVCPVRREVDVYVAMGRARDMATALEFDDIDRTRIEIAVLELTRNILAHAGSGELIIEYVTDGNRQGIAIEARDQGPGIADIALALRDGYSTAQTLGAGLPGVQRLMDDFHIESTVGVGTRVRAVKWPGKRANSGPGKVRR
ncbi:MULTISPECIES: anti-sigma regulatory factor [Roseiflexus]|jgi:anti-sigma regulatory factor (Ser/Thr protein kinase)|uniref:Putative anti-sigma regulatory factor, serine/threonine protein kinase n=1 Tax=Roseiflexus castenholzii (strain DSM 13941 / HLO8) TaxID=383372 RepID=A7NNS8_ROSCS|nr:MULTISPECIES: anti-sigma regulatory factor [Roseiflexus]ABU59222.1 putative anti-sigma regulatory factor, serine/threonine protein kinase [Roseiflexus castenholzii DSM 13941]PMP74354.1 MAG: anti-sigma regulatory factor [Roseiflexus castenholzii]GIW02281.1 MAG: anti-sigma regulatory factor [Roseiflexus sp.]